MNRRHFLAASGATALALASSGCGYQVGGKAATTPKSIQTIAIVPFKNLTSRYKISDSIQQALFREFVARTQFRVTRDRDMADAILDGVINSVFASPVVFDRATNKTTVIQLSIYLNIQLRERTTGKILFQRPNFGILNNYEVSINANQYFDEGNLAVARISADLARTIVSALLEDF